MKWGGVFSENYYLEAGKGDGIIKKIKDVIDKIIKRIKEFFVKKKDPNEIIKVPQNAIKETKSFLDKAEKLLSNIRTKIEKHPNATVVALVSLLGFSIATVWKKDAQKGKMTECQRKEIESLIKKSDSILHKYMSELSDNIGNRYKNQVNIMNNNIDLKTGAISDDEYLTRWKKLKDEKSSLDNKRKELDAKFHKERSAFNTYTSIMANHEDAVLKSALTKVWQLISLIGSVVSTLIIVAK